MTNFLLTVDIKRSGLQQRYIFKLQIGNSYCFYEALRISVIFRQLPQFNFLVGT